MIIPIFILAVFIYGKIKKVKVFDSFVEGAKGAIPLVVSLFPYIFAMFFMIEVFTKSGLSVVLKKLLDPFVSIFGIPKELTEMLILKPFSGGGSLALLSDIYTTYGVDSFISLCASCIYGSSETLFYVVATYFNGVKHKQLSVPIIISLVSCFIGVVFGCFICNLIV